MYDYCHLKLKTHRLIPSRYPPVLLFDWAESEQELEQLAALEGLTNDRLKNELGDIRLVSEKDWVSGEGATPLMAAFTHIGFPSRFSDGSFGIYYAADSLAGAVAETKFHREIFMQASNEPACLVQMREYISLTLKPLVDLTDKNKYDHYLNSDISMYEISQKFGRTLKEQEEWGLKYPSVRRSESICFAILRPSALTLPIQGCHLNYIWDGHQIAEIKVLKDFC